MSAALIVLVVAGGVFVLASVIDSIVRLENRTWWVAHSYQVIDTSDLILADLAEAESYQRGYLLTGKDSYLSHYEIAAQRSSNRAQALHGMVKDKDAQLARAKDLERLIQSRVASLQKGIDVRKSDGVEAARLYLNQGYGASLMARVRLKSAEMKNAEGQLLDTRKVEERETTAHLRQAVIAAITVLAVMVLAASLIANEVHHNRRKLTDMIDSVGDAFFAMDGKWRISHFNEMAAQFFGLEPAKVIGRRFLEAFPNVAGSELEVTCHAAMQSGKPQALETFLPRIEKHIEVRCFPSREGLSVFCHDISGRVEQERQIQELNELLERRVLDRTAQLETFCYSVAHDMRMHIRGISVNSTMILEELQPGKNPLVREKLERLTIATKQMSRLVDDLLKFARTATQDVQLSEVDLSALAHEIADGLRLDGSCSEDAKFEIDPALYTQADPQLAGVVLQNLMENACKYCRTDQTLLIKIGSLSPTVFFVQDNGVGFDQQYGERIFMPFERLHSDGRIPGSGIGLANVKRIIEKHGGRIWARSQVGVGSTFYFTFIGGDPQE